MKKTVAKMVKTGYGFGLLSLAKAKNIAAQAKKELNLNDEESLRLAKELVASSEKVSRDILKIAEKSIAVALTRTGIVKKRDLLKVKKAVRKRIRKMKAKRK